MSLAITTKGWEKAIQECGVEMEHIIVENPLVYLSAMENVGSVFIGIGTPSHEVNWLNSAIAEGVKLGKWGVMFFGEITPDVRAVLVHTIVSDKLRINPWTTTNDLINTAKRLNLAGTLAQKGLQVTPLERKSRAVWEGPMLDRSGYSCDTSSLIKWGPDVKIKPLQWGPTRLRRTADEWAILQNLAQMESTEEIYIESGFPTHFVKKDAYTVGRTMYESSILPKVWGEAVKIVDELWVPSEYCVDLFSRYHHNVHLITSPIDTTIYRPRGESFGSMRSNRVCRFLFVGEWVERKNWRMLLDGMSLAFKPEDDVELVIKTYNTLGKSHEVIQSEIRSFLPLSIPVTYVGGTLNESEMAWLYNSCHCLVHPAHSEGFGRPVAEMLACGREAISHGVTGLKDIQPNPIPATWVDIPDRVKHELPQIQEDGHQWLDISKDDLVEALRASYQRWSSGEVLSARDHIIKTCSGPVAYRQMSERLSQL